MKRIVAFILLFAVAFVTASCGVLGRKDTVKFDKKNTKVIAHRGLSGLETENTEAAFIAAGERSYYGIEADIKRTADGKFVVCHDDNLLKISGKDIEVGSSTLDELMKIRIFDKSGNNKEGVFLTDLAGYISICKSYEKQAILEFKTDFTYEEIARIIDEISRLDYLGKVTFISSIYDDLLCVRKILPGQSVQYVMANDDGEIIEKLLQDKFDLAIRYFYLTEDIIDKFHNAGLKVNCWTINSKVVAERYANMGVDYITTNILE